MSIVKTAGELAGKWGQISTVEMIFEVGSLTADIQNFKCITTPQFHDMIKAQTARYANREGSFKCAMIGSEIDMAFFKARTHKRGFIHICEKKDERLLYQERSLDTLVPIDLYYITMHVNQIGLWEKLVNISQTGDLYARNEVLDEIKATHQVTKFNSTAYYHIAR